MFGLGWANKELGSYKPQRLKCENCDELGTIEISIKGVYASFWMIPLFPFRKKGRSECGNCFQKLKPKKMPHSLLLEYDNFESTVRAPLWQYFGVAVLPILIVLALYQSEKSDNRQMGYLNEPQIGDVYSLDVMPGRFTTFKIHALSDDSIQVVYNSKEVKKYLKILTIDKAENYVSQPMSMAKVDIKNMYKQELIRSIKRN